ncbi:MAG: DUF4258 domain-containing protein [Dehalococcoidia bacterium]
MGYAMHPYLSPHAQVRMQQRAISAEALERLLDFGSVKHLARDKEIVFFDKKANKRLAKADKGVARGGAERPFKTYKVVGGNGVVVTVGHQYRRILRCTR